MTPSNAAFAQWRNHCDLYWLATEQGLSPSAEEEVIGADPHAAEHAVLGIADSFEAHAPLGLMAIKVGVERRSVGMVRERIGPVAAPRLSKTRRGRIPGDRFRNVTDSVNDTVPLQHTARSSDK